MATTADGNSTTYDRRLWVNATGNVMFGAGSGTANVITSPNTYLDGNWHHVVASLDPANGMVLYLDGVVAGTQATYTLGNYTGTWRWGGEATNATWPGPHLLLRPDRRGRRLRCRQPGDPAGLPPGPGHEHGAGERA